jgi:hypothetical protein
MPSRKIIDDLTAEQEALLPAYREKWRSICVSTEPIDRQKVAEVVKAAYLASDYPEPEILFYSSPLAAIQQVIQIENYRASFGKKIGIRFNKRVVDHIQSGLFQQLESRFQIKLRNQVQYPDFPHYPTQGKPLRSYFPHSISWHVGNQIITDFEKLMPELELADLTYFTDVLERPADRAVWSCFMDFCISVLGLHHDRKKWQAYQQLIQHSGFLFKYEKVCIACDRPCKLRFDSDNHLHAQDEPALQFADGYSVYATHGELGEL